MLDLDTTFAPRWASAPGKTIRDALSERGITVHEFAQAADMSREDIEALLSGDSAITLNVARRIERVIGGSVEFWIARDGQYRDDLARLAADNWATSLPTGDMVSLGWIAKPSSWRDRISKVLEFFDVPDVEDWHAKYGKLVESAHYRVAGAGQVDPLAVAAWLRQAERQADAVDTDDFDDEKFKGSLAAARALLRDPDPRSFLPALEGACSPAGVAVVIVKPPSRCSVSGAARFVSPRRALIVLTGRYLTDDHLWYTFFHEAAHVLRHRGTSTFVDQLERGKPQHLSDEESDVDDLATDLLLPGDALERLREVRPRPWDIRRFANKERLSPGIVVGQMQHHGRMAFATKLNALKRRYRWAGTSLERA